MKVGQYLVQKFSLAENKDAKKLLIQALNDSTEEPAPVKEEPKAEPAPTPVVEASTIESVVEELKEETPAPIETPAPVAEVPVKEEPKKELPPVAEVPKAETSENEYTTLISKWASDNGVTQFTPQHLVNCIVAIA
jgi:hypothetical protein